MMHTILRYTIGGITSDEKFESQSKAVISADILKQLSDVTSVVIIEPDGKEVKIK